MPRRASRTRRRGRSRRRHHPLFVLFAVVMAITLAATGTLALAALLALVMSTAQVLLIVVVVALVLRMRRRAAWRRAARARHHAEGLARARPPETTERRWLDAQQRMARLRAEYAGFECDPLAVLRLPALADVRVGATARFVDAFAEAQALDTDRLPEPPYAARYADAVDRACRAWRAARESAERIRLSGLSADERARVDRVIKLLTIAADTGHDAERQAAYAKARDELLRLERSGTISLPRPARFALDDHARGRLPA